MKKLNSNLVGRKVKLDLHTWRRPNGVLIDDLARWGLQDVADRFLDATAEVCTAYLDNANMPKFQLILPNGEIISMYDSAFTVLPRTTSTTVGSSLSFWAVTYTNSDDVVEEATLNCAFEHIWRDLALIAGDVADSSGITRVVRA